MYLLQVAPCIFYLLPAGDKAVALSAGHLEEQEAGDSTFAMRACLEVFGGWEEPANRRVSLRRLAVLRW